MAEVDPPVDALDERVDRRRLLARFAWVIRMVMALSLALAPWTWFLVRDRRPALEWAAIAMPVVVVAAVSLIAVAALVAWSWHLLVVAVAWTAFGLAAVVGPWMPADQGEPADAVRVAVANIGGPPSPEQADDELILDDLTGFEADVLVVLESASARDLDQQLASRYPYSYRPERRTDVAVWSRFPLQGGALPGGEDLRATRGARVIVEAPGAPFALYALHLFPPSPDSGSNRLSASAQRALVERLDAVADSDDLPVVLAGDLNLPDRGPAFRVLADQRVDAGRASWTGPTSVRDRNRPLLLRIDHLLLPNDWCADDARRPPLAGSDHRAVLADVGPCS